MIHSVVIPSTGRPDVLGETVASFARQTVRPREIIVSVALPSDVRPETASLPGVVVVRGARGSSVQRNRAVQHVAAESDVVSFFDDDVELAPDHLEAAQQLFARSPDVVLFWGRMIADGAKHGSISRAEARRLLDGHAAGGDFVEADRGGRGALGGDMHVRRELLTTLGFDERLRLYGWQEDRDLAARAARFGRIGRYDPCVFVHLGVASGRVSGGKYGFAQVMNPVYLWRKGSIPALDAVSLGAMALARNAVGAVVREKRIDRAGRLRGNLAALSLLLRRRVEPEHVVNVR